MSLILIVFSAIDFFSLFVTSWLFLLKLDDRKSNVIDFSVIKNIQRKWKFRTNELCFNLYIDTVYFKHFLAVKSCDIKFMRGEFSHMLKKTLTLSLGQSALEKDVHSSPSHTVNGLQNPPTALPNTKIKLQLYPIDENTRVGLVKVKNLKP